MTVSTLNNIVIYTGNSSATHFAVPFKVLDVSHLVVTRRVLATGVDEHTYVGTDYSYTGIGADAGTLTLNGAPLSATYQLVIERIVPYTQELDLINAGGFYPETVETQLDLTVMGVQQIAAEADDLASRALLVPHGQTAPAYADFAATFKGDPGGNVMAVGPFTGINFMQIPDGVDLIRTSEFRAGSRVGGAFYIRDPVVDLAFSGAHAPWAVSDASGNGFRLVETQTLWIEMFGAHGDATPLITGSDDASVFDAVKDFQKYFSRSPTGNTDYKPTFPIHLMNRGYRSSGPLIIDSVANCFIGCGNNFNGYGGSVIYFDSDQPGIIIQCWDNIDTTLTGTFSHHVYGTDPRGGQNAEIRNITVVSRDGDVGNSDQCGVVMHTAAKLDGVHAFDFAGYGIAVFADVGAGSNANAAQIVNCGAQRCGLGGYYDQGGDVNAGIVLSFQAFSNRGFGLYAGNFLGQFYMYFQCDGNGIYGSGPSWATNNVSSFANYGGHIWYVVPGQRVAASTTQPGTDAAVWSDLGAGSTSLGPTWVSGMVWQSGGGFFAGGVDFGVNNNSRNVFAGYCEGNQYAGWSSSSTSACMPSFSGFQNGGASLGVVNNAFVSGAMGYRGTALNGDVVQFLLGAAGNADGAVFTFGRGPTGELPWRALLDANNVLSFLYNGGGGTSPMNMQPGGNHPFSMEFPNGHTSGGVFVTTGSAAPTTGTWGRGDRVNNNGAVTGLNVTDHWVCSVAGTPGTWLAKA